MGESGATRPFALLDASVIFAGIVGNAKGASATILATIRLGGMDAFTTENAMEETRRHLLFYFNRKRLKVHSTEADRELEALRRAPRFSVVPWVHAPSSVLPDNRKDAYLVEAARRYRPLLLFTSDDRLLDLSFIEDTLVVSPAVFLAGLDKSTADWST